MSSNREDIDKICTLLDKLTLDALSLIEEEVQTKIQIENAMCSGETHLAKSRYILGQNNVSSIQLPTENSNEFEATAVVINSGSIARELEVVKQEEQIDPVRWFGYLVPQDLYHAQSMFKQTLHWVVRAANLQTQIIETCTTIHKLNDLKRNKTGN